MLVKREMLIELIKSENTDWDDITDGELEDLSINLGLKDKEGFDLVIEGSDKVRVGCLCQITFDFEPKAVTLTDSIIHYDLGGRLPKEFKINEFYVHRIHLRKPPKVGRRDLRKPLKVGRSNLERIK